MPVAPDLTLDATTLAVLIGAAFAGGVVNGLVGFGVGLISMVFWLLVIDPIVAVPLMAVGALALQIIMLRFIWHALDRRRLLPMIVGMAIGVPIGGWLLTRVDPVAFKVMLGFALAGYSGWRLAMRRPRRRVSEESSPLVRGIVGMVGGFFGGFAGVTAPTISLWASLRGWGKEEQRAVYQPMMLAVAVLMLATYAVNGVLTAEVGRLALYTVPALLSGCWIGALIYRRLNDMQFATVILVLILLSGLNLALRSLWAG